MPVNEFGQPVGDPLDWTPGLPLTPVTLRGRTCRLEPLTEAHVDGLYDALCTGSPDTAWTYLTAGPFTDRGTFAAYLDRLRAAPATIPLAIVLPDDTPVGVATWLRVDHAMGTAEVGHITYAASLQRTTPATEAMSLMAGHAFDVVGVRRYEWKCDCLNEPSMRAAGRLGFSFEGVFRKAVHYKGRNRDTAWFAITDDEWPRVRAAFETWLDPANFDDDGRQVRPLSMTEAPA
ncbi:MAG: GNAT family N-acetyltransferase [Marmoricola sp.]